MVIHFIILFVIVLGFYSLVAIIYLIVPEGFTDFIRNNEEVGMALFLIPILISAGVLGNKAKGLLLKNILYGSKSYKIISNGVGFFCSVLSNSLYSI